MKINVRLTPVGDGRWHWAIGRAGVLSHSGNADSLEAAQNAAEDAAQQYVAEIKRASFYLFDTDSHERIGYEEG